MEIDETYTKLKPVVNELIRYYYELPENGAGGNCHIVLEDGNLTKEDISFCQDVCAYNNDYLGYLIMMVLRYFTVEELEEMYEKDWGIVMPEKYTWFKTTTKSRPGLKQCNYCNRPLKKTRQFDVLEICTTEFRGDDIVLAICGKCMTKFAKRYVEKLYA